MQEDDLKKFAVLMAKFEIAFSEQITKEKMTLYFDYLDDLTIAQIGQAVDYLIERRERRGIPTIAEIRSATLGAIEYKAVQAWGELLNQKFQLEKSFEDRLIPEVTRIAFGSLDAFYSGEERNEMADRAHFLRAYKLIANLKEAQEGKRKRLPE